MLIRVYDPLVTFRSWMITSAIVSLGISISTSIAHYKDLNVLIFTFFTSLVFGLISCSYYFYFLQSKWVVSFHKIRNESLMMSFSIFAAVGFIVGIFTEIYVVSAAIGVFVPPAGIYFNLLPYVKTKNIDTRNLEKHTDDELRVCIEQNATQSDDSLTIKYIRDELIKRESITAEN